MKPPADYFRDNLAALQAWQMIEAAQIPPEPSFDTFADYATNDAYNAALRVFKAAQAERRVKVRNVAAEIAKRWPATVVRNVIAADVSGYVFYDAARWRDVSAVFDAAREEAAVLDLEESK